MIGETISHYKIIRKIGGGGMGVIYEAEDTRLHRRVALKFIHPQLITDEQLKKRFLREAQAASSLDHPNICNIYEVDETPDGRLFICMAFYGGESLSHLAKKAPLTAREVFQIGFSVAQGLSCAHRNGIIHRDIKPGNIMITPEGHIKIVDFGLAKLTGSTRLTRTDMTIGTVRYMSPEQSTGKTVDHRSDIWSLGVIMYELATGKTPFRGDIDAAVIYSILHEDPPPANEVEGTDVSEEGARIIAKCLEKDADERYQSVDELIADINQLAGEIGWGSSIASFTIPIVERRQPRRAGRKLRITGVIAAMIVVFGSLITWVATREPSPYTTDVRLAMIPLINKTLPARDHFVEGLTESINQILEHTSRQHESMWVVPSRLVSYAQLPGESAAREAFGVNRIVTGDVQRFANRQLLQLHLKDATSLESIRSVSLPFDIESPSALVDSLSIALLRLIDAGDEITAISALFLPGDAAAAKSYLEGIGAMQDGDLDVALVSLGTFASEDSPSAVGLGALGWASWLKHRATGEDTLLAQSIGHLEKATELEPAISRFRFDLGEIQRRTGNDDAAVTSFLSVIKDDPGNPLACRGLSRVYRKQKRYDEAERILQTVIERWPDYFEAHRIRAVYFFRVNDEEQAIRDLQMTLKLAPNDAYSLNTLGVIYHDRGQYSVARSHFERAFQLLPMCDTCCNVGMTLYFEGRYKESASYYEYALEYCDENDTKLWGSWASSLYWVDGERGRAIELFNTAIGLAAGQLQETPDNPILVGALVEYYAMIGDEANSRRWMAEAERFAMAEPEVLYSIGDAHEIFGDRGAALRYLGEAVRRGFPVGRIEGTRELFDLVQDPRFKQMVLIDEGPDKASSGSTN
jgi:serine/threonine protein kinase/tetratricopeptide (TPR) repeat protein